MKETKKCTEILRYSHRNVEVLDIKTKYQGFFKLDEYHLSHQLFSGEQSTVLTREIFERGDAVVLVLYDPALDNVILLEQFRPGAIRNESTPWMLEFVAGMFDDNESPIDVAVREAKEEADLDVTADDIVPVMNYFSSPGGMSECIHMFAARVDSRNIAGVHGLEEEGEDILLHVMSREQANTLLTQGKIANAATIIGLQWLTLNYAKLQETWLNK
ncbi:NUDIX domain-containing protein [Colwelliaceae bacterium 6471]